MSWLKPRPTKIREPSDCCGSPRPFAFAECKQVPARHTRILERSLCCGSPGCFPSLKILPHISNFRRNQRTGGLRRCSLPVAAPPGRPPRLLPSAKNPPEYQHFPKNPTTGGPPPLFPPRCSPHGQARAENGGGKP